MLCTCYSLRKTCNAAWHTNRCLHIIQELMFRDACIWQQFQGTVSKSGMQYCAYTAHMKWHMLHCITQRKCVWHGSLFTAWTCHLSAVWLQCNYGHFNTALLFIILHCQFCYSEFSTFISLLWMTNSVGCSTIPVLFFIHNTKLQQ